MFSLTVSVMIAHIILLEPFEHTTIDRKFKSQQECATAMNRAMIEANNRLGYRFAGFQAHPNGKLELCGTI